MLVSHGVAIFDLHRPGASFILHQVGLCRALLGQAAWQSAAASLVGLDQGVHWQSVVFHHPGADHHDESRRNPHLYKLDYLYPALTVACEGSWSLVRSHRDSKKWENCLILLCTAHLSSGRSQLGYSCRQQSTRCSPSWQLCSWRGFHRQRMTSSFCQLKIENKKRRVRRLEK